MKKEITSRQKELLKYIIQQIRDFNLPPSVSEMAKYLKVSSKSAVAKLLNALETSGHIKISGKARDFGLDSLGESLEKG